MAIFLNEDSKIIVQGMTGAEGMKHTQRMLAGGSNIVGGVNPRKAGETVNVEGKDLPVFGTVAEAMAATGANVSVIFVPPAFAKAAIMEAIDARFHWPLQSPRASQFTTPLRPGPTTLPRARSPA